MRGEQALDFPFELAEAPAVERLAWARAEPSPRRLTALVDRIERTVGNG